MQAILLLFLDELLEGEEFFQKNRTGKIKQFHKLPKIMRRNNRRVFDSMLFFSDLLPSCLINPVAVIPKGVVDKGYQNQPIKNKKYKSWDDCQLHTNSHPFPLPINVCVT